MCLLETLPGEIIQKIVWGNDNTLPLSRALAMSSTCKRFRTLLFTKPLATIEIKYTSVRLNSKELFPNLIEYLKRFKPVTIVLVEHCNLGPCACDPCDRSMQMYTGDNYASRLPNTTNLFAVATPRYFEQELPLLTRLREVSLKFGYRNVSPHAVEMPFDYCSSDTYIVDYTSMCYLEQFDFVTLIGQSGARNGDLDMRTVYVHEPKKNLQSLDVTSALSSAKKIFGDVQLVVLKSCNEPLPILAERTFFPDAGLYDAKGVKKLWIDSRYAAADLDYYNPFIGFPDLQSCVFYNIPNSLFSVWSDHGFLETWLYCNFSAGLKEKWELVLPTTSARMYTCDAAFRRVKIGT